jgi:D-alanyl-D-alanine carboxypeptidase
MSNHRVRSGSRLRFQLGASVAALALAGGLAVAGTQTASSAHANRSPDAVQQSLDTLVRDDKYPAALAAVQGRDGRIRNYTSGVGNLKTKARVPVDGYVRIGSNTKTFTAVVVLQLVAEGKVKLDEPVETYLPGLIRGNGNDGRRITVRQILQHTSGLPSYTNFLANGLLPYQHTYFSPRQALDIALKDKPTGKPGEKWAYSNTGYVVAGLLIERVTGRPLIEEITKRTIDRIGLRETYFPNVGDQGIRQPHASGYHADDPANPLTDVTESDPSFGWAAGQMISTPSDVGRFFTALLDGKLLDPAQLAVMRQTVPATEFGAGVGYGLGITSTPLSCGGVAWGHGGAIPGYATFNAATDDGRAATIAVTKLVPAQAEVDRLNAALDKALCR